MSDKPSLTHADFIKQLRALMEQAPTPPPLTAPERKVLHNAVRMSDAELQASIALIDASDHLAHALGVSANDVRQIVAGTYGWGAAEVELRGATRSVADGNLIRRERAAILARQAYIIGTQLVRDPEHRELETFLDEIKRLKALQRRRRKPPAKPDGEEEPEP